MNGNIIRNDNSSVTLSISSGPAGARISGTLTVPVSGGQAVFKDLSVSLPGSYQFTATDGDVAPIVSGTVAVAAPGNVKPTWVPGLATAAFGQPLQLTVLAPGKGTVSFFDGPDLLGTTSTNDGLAFTWVTGLFSPGEHSIRAYYSGNQDYNPSLSEVRTVNVNPPSTIGCTITSSTLPASVVAERPTAGIVWVRLSNNGPTRVRGKVAISLMAVANNDTDNIITVIGYRDMVVSMGSGQSLEVPIPARADVYDQGNHWIIANVEDASGTTTYSPQGPSLQVKAPVVALSERFLRLTLPAAVVAGSAIRAVAVLEVTNSGNVAPSSDAGLTIVATRDGISSPFVVPQKNGVRPLPLRPGGRAVIVVPLLGVPLVSDGDYAISAQVTVDQPASDISSAAWGQVLNISAPRVSLSAEVTRIVPQALHAGHHALAVVIVSNAGNIAAVGPARMQVMLSPDDQPDQTTTLLDLSRPMRIGVGRRALLLMPIVLPTTPDSYLLVASIEQGDQTAATPGVGVIVTA